MGDAIALGFTIPAGSAIGNTAARFRTSSLGGLGPTGPAFDGEVEDYIFALVADTGDALELTAEATTMIDEISVVNDETSIFGSSESFCFARRERSLKKSSRMFPDPQR